VSRPLRYTFILLIAALGTALAAVGGWRYARASAPVQGPVILISVGTLRADHLPAYGYRAGATPAIDSLAHDGVVFERAYAHSTQTLPSHATMMTGRLPFEHGVRDDDGASLGADERPLAQLLRDRGYATGGIVSSALLGRATGIARGFEFFDDELPLGDGDLSPAYRRRSGAASEDIAERWLSGLGTSRLFLFLHIDEPRSPRGPSSYDDAITAADAVVGRFVRYLRAHQLYEQSTILLVSDHGEGLGDHGEQEHGLFLYNEAIHVPLIVKPAGGAGAGRRIADVVQLADIVPTVLDLVKAPGPGNLRGRSLKPLTEGPATLQATTVYSESVYGRNRFGWSALVSMTDGQFQFIRAPREELYDLRKDARERDNLVGAADAKTAREELRTALTAVTGPAPADDAAAAPDDPKDKAGMAEDYRSALRLTAERKWPEAIDALQKIVRAEPAAIAPWTTMAEVAALSERFDIAQTAAQHVVELAPDDPAALVRAGQIALDAHKLDDAAQSAQQAIDLGTKNSRAVADAHAVLALVALARYDTDTARSEALDARKADSASVVPLFVNARILVDEGNDTEALAVLEKANAGLEQSKAAPLPQLKALTGEVLVRSDRAAEAEMYFVDELRDFPHNLAARASLAMLYQSMGQTDDAARVAADLVRITPSPEAYATAAKLWTSFGDPKQAAATRADARKLFAVRRTAH
jgi:arylsulfatase A-like enzyme/Tfp pilus assembly protein PilF